MKNVIVDIVAHATQIPNFEELLPLENQVVSNWKKEGLLEQLYLKHDTTGVFLVFSDLKQSKVEELIKTLPLYQFFEKIEINTVEKQF
ncbi:hypothetical protein [Pustulibacterium marinum]|nr:hypothetical protein [Pustulibacterium marinum]